MRLSDWQHWPFSFSISLYFLCGPGIYLKAGRHGFSAHQILNCLLVALKAKAKRKSMISFLKTISQKLLILIHGELFRTRLKKYILIPSPIHLLLNPMWEWKEFFLEKQRTSVMLKRIMQVWSQQGVNVVNLCVNYVALVDRAVFSPV